MCVMLTAKRTEIKATKIVDKPFLIDFLAHNETKIYGRISKKNLKFGNKSGLNKDKLENFIENIFFKKKQ